MHEIKDYNCVKCPMVEKICRSKNGKGPKKCPTEVEKKVLAAAMKEYKRPEVSEFARVAYDPGRVLLCPAGCQALCLNPNQNQDRGTDRILEADEV